MSVAPAPGDGVARWRLLASAVAGRSLQLAAADAGAPAWTDGTTIYVDPAADARRQVAAVAVQASLVSAGSLDEAIARSLARRPALARRYLAVEGHRALAARRHLLPTWVCSVVDERVAARCATAAQSLAVAGSGEAVGEPPELFGVLRPKRVIARLEQRAGPDGTPVHVPRRPVDRPVDGLGAGQVDDEEDDGAPPSLDMFSSPVGGGGGIGRLLKRVFGERRSDGVGPPGADAPTRVSTRGVARAGAVLSTAVARVPEGTGVFAPSGATYPEWDAGRGRYRPGWCTVTEPPAPTGDRGPWSTPDTHRLRRSLSRLGTELERRRRQLQGDDVDVDAAVEARVEVAAGAAPSEALYIDNVRSRRDLAVLVLLDVSGSAGLPGPTGAPVHEHQRAAAAALTRCLHDLGDRVALYGFRSQGRAAVHVLPVKRFTDDVDSAAMARLGGLAPGGYTRLGAAIRHGAAVVERDGGTARRLLVVLSDGLAYDHGYETAYGEADARRALAEARRRGIGCLCLSVGAGADADALRRVFGTAAHASIDRSDDLPAVAGPLLRAALRSAEARRRAWQRAERTRERLVLERRTA